MTLELLICTIDDGILNVPKILLPPSSQISYLISWQHSAGSPAIDLPTLLIRDDVRIVELQGKGLSRNRNNALAHASGDICLIADDDCSYTQNALIHIIKVFESHPSIDLATFKMTYSQCGKKYPSFSFDLRHTPKNYYVSSVEIAFRRKSIQGCISFNELFGLGAPVLQSGEEDVFILGAINAGLHCQYFPYEIVTHEHPTTSTTKARYKGVLMARGAYLYLAHPNNMYLRAVRISQVLSRSGQSGFFHSLRHILKGISYARKSIK